MAKQTERHDINDELYIFKQDNSERWYARFILTNHKKWLCKSTKKKDKDEAIAMAHRIFLDHQIRHENNTLVQSKRFKDVADRVIEKLEEQLEHGGGKRTYKDYIRALENYHIPYFSRTFITSIDQEEISKFDEWRKGRMKKSPASSTLLTHNAALQLVFKEAIEQKWMIAAQVPVLSSKGGTGTRRAAFSEEEYDVILNEIYEGEQNAHSEKTRQIRELLYDYCEIAVNTGIRPGTEMEHLTWKDIEIKTQGSKAQFFINVSKGKTTKYTGPRKVVCKRDVIGALTNLRERFPLRTPNQKLFLLASGEPTRQLGKAFEKALKFGTKESPRDRERYTLFDIPHYVAASQRNQHGRIARQCGTSTAMIEQHYRQEVEMFADALSGVTFDKEEPKALSKKTLNRCKDCRALRKTLKEWPRS